MFLVNFIEILVQSVEDLKFEILLVGFIRLFYLKFLINLLHG